MGRAFGCPGLSSVQSHLWRQSEKRADLFLGETTRPEETTRERSVLIFSVGSVEKPVDGGFQGIQGLGLEAAASTTAGLP